MFCLNCGRHNDDGVKFCERCGHELVPREKPQREAQEDSGEAREPVPEPERPRTSGMAIASLVLGILGPVTALAGLVLGFIALNQIGSSKGRLQGSGLATAGLAVSGVMALAGILIAAAGIPNMFIAPAFHGAREKATQTSCLSNVKQLNLGLLMYAQDYDEHWAPADRWCDVTEPYVRSQNVYVCPGLPEYRCGYAYNERLSMTPVKNLSSPADTPTIFDATGGWNQYGGPSLLDFRHQGMANVGFADGHGNSLRMVDTGSLQWQPTVPVPGSP